MTLGETQQRKEQVKSINTIPDILRRYGVDVRRGRCKAICHSGDGLTAKVTNELYYCFKCCKSMDIFDITMHFNHCDFKTAFELLGGTKQPSFRATVMADKARKERELRLIQEQQQKTNERTRQLLMRAYRNIMEEENRLSDLYVYCYNKLQYLLYQIEYELETR